MTAVEFSELYSLSKSDLEKMLVDWPEMSSELYSLMDEFVTGLPSEHSAMRNMGRTTSIFGVATVRRLWLCCRKRGAASV